MEIDETTQARLIALAVGVVIVIAWKASSASTRRQSERFAAIARELGATVTRESEFNSHFSYSIAERKFEIRNRSVGEGQGTYVITGTPLRGVSDTHSAEIRPRSRRSGNLDPDAAEFAQDFPVRDFGYPLRDGWATGAVRSAIAAFYALDFPLASLLIEESTLRHRSPLPIARFDAAIVRAILERQAVVAEALERSLGR